MKTLGLIGGTSWSSTAEYYRYINEETARRLGGLHSARMVIASIDFAELEQAMKAYKWGEAASILIDAGHRLHAAGAEAILLCSNLIHRMFDDIQKTLPIPMLHIGDAIAADIKAKGLSTVALLGARATMEEPFYINRIEQKSGAYIMTPSPYQRDYVHYAIFNRLCRNEYNAKDRAKFIEIIQELKDHGAESVILGCTELPILLPEAPLPLINSTQLHSICAVDFAVSPPPSYSIKMNPQPEHAL